MYIERRQRRLVRFTIDERKPLHAELWEWLLDRKALREMAPTIIAALRLYRSLQSGDTTLLYEMFPALRPSIDANITERLAAMEAKLARVYSTRDALSLDHLEDVEEETQPARIVNAVSDGKNAERALKSMKAFL